MAKADVVYVQTLDGEVSPLEVRPGCTLHDLRVQAAALLGVYMLELELLHGSDPLPADGVVAPTLVGETVIAVAQGLSEAQLRKMNERDGIGRSVLHRAAMRGDAQAARNLLNDERFIEVNSVTKDGRSALHYACEYGQLDAARVLVEHPRFTITDVVASLGVMGKLTAAELAIKYGQFDVAELVGGAPIPRPTKKRTLLSFLRWSK